MLLKYVPLGGGIMDRVVEKRRQRIDLSIDRATLNILHFLFSDLVDAMVRWQVH
jgi:hypothetical protein